MTAQIQRQRVQPTPDEIDHARTLLKAVPSVGLDWLSEEGQAFLAYANSLVADGRPIAWLADPLKLDVNRLYTILNRYRRALR